MNWSIRLGISLRAGPIGPPEILRGMIRDRVPPLSAPFEILALHKFLVEKYVKLHTID